MNWDKALGSVRRHAVVCALVLVVGATYARTLLPGLHGFGDVTKAQFLGRVLGMTHPTGYPLYILLTAPVSHLPLGSLAVRINAFSAVMGVIAVVFAYALQRRLGVRGPLAAVCALAFAWSTVAWEQFVIAEVYALGAALVGAVLCLLLRTVESGRRAWFLAAALVYALSFGNHLTVVTLLPAFALGTLFGWQRSGAAKARWPLGSTAAWVGLFIAIGALQYAYLFWASASDSPYLEYRVKDCASFADYVSGARYRGRMFAFGIGELLWSRLPRFVLLLLRDLCWLPLLAPLGVVGAFWGQPGARSAGRPSPVRARMTAVLVLAGLGQLLWLCAYDIPDIDVYAIPLLLIVAVLSGQGAEWLSTGIAWGWARLQLQANEPRAASGPGCARSPMLACALVLGAVVVWAAPSHAPSHQTARVFERRMEQELAVLGTGAVVVGAIHYGPRMAFVERLYAEGLSQTHDLHLAPTAKPKQVRRYLAGRGHLRDSALRLTLEPGRRVFVHERGARVDYGPGVRKVRRGTLWELVAKRRSK